jgi:hypothetical protein
MLGSEGKLHGGKRGKRGKGDRRSKRGKREARERREREARKAIADLLVDAIHHVLVQVG